MKNDEIVNCALATLQFCFNNRYAFFKNPGIRAAYHSAELLPVEAQTEDEFDVLTNNSLLAGLQSHAILLNEAVKDYCLDTGRPEYKNDPLFDPIRNFVSELRNAKYHPAKRSLKSTWMKTFKFECWIPVEKVGNEGYRYSYTSKVKHKIVFKGTKGRELRIVPGFIYRLVIFSYHLRHILSLRKKVESDKYLGVYRGKFTVQ